MTRTVSRQLVKHICGWIDPSAMTVGSVDLPGVVFMRDNLMLDTWTMVASEEWHSCDERPSDSRRVLVWHRARPWCRYYKPVVGWWNTAQWCRDDSQFSRFGKIYQPVLWCELPVPKLKGARA